ncbi:MAG: hypothetical protein PHO63_02590 [Bacilli bacterium]|nr:hypothetical protein [Bacilli bacterium]MDD4809390.1 hypothetical protein [Bacilli bacterium]
MDNTNNEKENLNLNEQSVQTNTTPSLNQNMYSDSKYIFTNGPDKEPVPTGSYKPVGLDDSQTAFVNQPHNSNTDPNIVALATLQAMLDKLKQTPLVAREELYENIGHWFEDTYIDDETDDGFKTINYDTYVKMLQLYVDAEKYLDN